MLLRPYQEKIIRSLRDAFSRKKKSLLLVSPTGSGKTVIFCHIAQAAMQKGTRVLILAHREELITQTSSALDSLEIPHGIISANRTPNPLQLVQVASVQTLARRLGRPQRYDLIIIDEAHHSAAGSWKKIISAFPAAKIIGVTATPQRLDGKGLGDIFEEIILGPNVAELIETGFLCQPIYYAPSTVNLDGVKNTAGDYNKAQLEQKTNTPVITGCAVSHYKRICDGAPCIVFCVSIKHAQDVAQQFRESGYRFDVIDGTLSPEARKKRVSDLATGKIHGLTSCEIVSEGFDLPLVTCAILLRATQSLSLHLQQIGRVLRPHASKTRAIILDHVNNCMRHGLAEEEREWSLDPAKKKKKTNTETSERNRQCPACYCVHSHTASCPQCGHVYTAKPRELEQVAGELVEIKARMMTREQGKARTLAELIDLGKLRGYRNPSAWAGHILRARKI